MSASFALLLLVAIFGVLVLVAEILGRRVQGDVFIAGIINLAKTDRPIDSLTVTDVYLGARGIARSELDLNELRRLQTLIVEVLASHPLRGQLKVERQLRAVLQELSGV